jgi:outer membrane autotransporter protein
MTPHVALQVQHFRAPAYGETATAGSADFALSYGAQQATAARSEIGARFDRSVVLSADAELALRGRAAWAHGWGGATSVNAAFTGLPGSGFTVTGAEAAVDSLMLLAGAELKLPSNIALIGRLEGELAKGPTSYSGTGLLRYAW